MPAICPFCISENASHALVCSTCSRDIAVPSSLIAERDDLMGKRDQARAELVRIKEELEQLRLAKKRRSG